MVCAPAKKCKMAKVKSGKLQKLKSWNSKAPGWETDTCLRTQALVVDWIELQKLNEKIENK